MSAYLDRIARGFCGIGGCPNRINTAENERVCPTHLQIAAERSAKQRKKNRKDGKCIDCKQKKKDIGPGGRCSDCLVKQAGGEKLRRDRKRAAGMCYQCPASDPQPAKPGCVLCQKHIDQLSKTASEHYRWRKEHGLCRFGNHPPLPGESLCAYHKQLSKDYRLRLKLEVMEVYGGACCSHPGCNCEDLDALDLHHTGGGGNQHRREIGVPSGGYNFYLWIRKHDYPSGYAVVCATHHRQADAELRRARLEV